MISVIEVYNTIRDLCNKDQKGFVTPKIFNAFAEVAQQNVFNEMFKELSSAKQLRARGLDPSGKDSVYMGVKDTLSNFITQLEFDAGLDSPYYVSANIFKKPTDVYRIISLRYDAESDSAESASWADVEMVYNTEKMPNILNSNLSAPTESFPVALIAKEIEVFPSDVDYSGSLLLTYYRNPASKFAKSVGGDIVGDVDTASGPRFFADSTLSDGFFVANLNNCRHFELPEEYKGEVIAEIAKMIGVRLRDPIISAYGTNETTVN